MIGAVCRITISKVALTQVLLVPIVHVVVLHEVTPPSVSDTRISPVVAPDTFVMPVGVQPLELVESPIAPITQEFPPASDMVIPL
jgi:hypothetical protein